MTAEPIPKGASSPSGDVRAFLDDYDDEDDCRCSSLFIDPNGLTFAFTPITGGMPFGESADFTPSWDATIDIPPCTSTVTLPSAPPPPAPFHSDAVAMSRFPFLQRIFWARVHGTFQTTYTVYPKDDCEQCTGVDIDLDGVLTGLQQATGRGFALAVATAYLEIEPFHPPLAGVTIGKDVTIPGPFGRPFGIEFDSPKMGFRLGGAFATPFHDRAFVPYGVPQNLLVRTMVYVQARLRVSAEARIDKLTFTLSGPDPKGPGVRVKVRKATVTKERLAKAPPPTAAPHHSLRRVLSALPREITTSIALHDGQLWLASVDERGSAMRQIDVRHNRVRTVRRLKGLLLARLRAVDLANGSKLCGIVYDTSNSEPDLLAPSRARVVSFDRNQRMKKMTRAFDLPADLTVAAPVRAGEAGIMVTDLGGGAVLESVRGGRQRLRIEGLASPDAIASPPPNSSWQGVVYVADTHRQNTSTGFADAGRVLEFRSNDRAGSTLLHDISSSALAFARGGAFGVDLLVAVRNVTDPQTLLPIPGTGRVLRVSPSGEMTVAVSLIDDPHDIAVSSDGRVFILCAHGLFELSGH